MKYLREGGRLFLALLSAAILNEGVNAEPTNWQIDSEHFSVAFEAEHIGYQMPYFFQWYSISSSIR